MRHDFEMDQPVTEYYTSGKGRKGFIASIELQYPKYFKDRITRNNLGQHYCFYKIIDNLYQGPVSPEDYDEIPSIRGEYIRPRRVVLIEKVQANKIN